MTPQEQAIYILSKCKCSDTETELKMIHIAFRYWESGCEPDEAVALAASFILDNDKSI